MLILEGFVIKSDFLNQETETFVLKITKIIFLLKLKTSENDDFKAELQIWQLFCCKTTKYTKSHILKLEMRRNIANFV